MQANRTVYQLSLCVLEMDWNLPLKDLASATQMVNGAQTALRASGLSLREPPPAPTTCCGRGCYECVWKDYYAALEVWRKEVCSALDKAV